jgi:AraC-like DNA-binding protein
MIVRGLELSRRQGHDTTELCREFGLHPALLADPEARIPYAVAGQLTERVVALTGDLNFGLHLAKDVESTGTFDAAALLLMASPTVRAALQRMIEHQRYWGDGQRSTWISRSDGAAVRYAMPGVAGSAARHSAECMMAEIALGIRVMTGAALCARRVRFRHAPPVSTHEHEQLFGCPIEFRAAHTEIDFDDATLEAPMQHANAAFCAIFEQQVQRALLRLPAACSASADVRATVQGALASGHCTLAGTARALGVSQRTLQRRLREEGTSFASVVRALRHELGTAYLERGIAITDVASLLGYADTTAFHHAFRRWHGVTPARATSRDRDRDD